MAVVAGPVRHFNRIRNTVTVLTGIFLWWRQHELSPIVVAISIGAGVVSIWIASFFHRED